MSTPKPELTTHERAEKMVEEALGERVGIHEGLVYVRGLDYGLVVKMWKLAVRLQAALLEKGGK